MRRAAWLYTRPCVLSSLDELNEAERISFERCVILHESFLHAAGPAFFASPAPKPLVLHSDPQILRMILRPSVARGTRLGFKMLSCSPKCRINICVGTWRLACRPVLRMDGNCR